MRRISFKLGLFLILWYELCAELGLSADAGFVWALVVIFGGMLALRFLAQLAGMIGPFTFGLGFQTLLWVILLWWLVPSVFQALPLVADLMIVLALALLGARCRFLFERRRLRRGPLVAPEYAGMLVAAVLGALLVGMWLVAHWGSVWPLIGYALLPGLPFSFGWRMAPLAAARRPDARVGDAKTFRDAGLSEER